MGSHAPLAPTGNVSSFVEDGIADVCFGHPKSNSLPSLVLRALADEITALGGRDDVRVVVLRSYGAGAFCAGASFDELSSIRDKDQGKEFFLGFARVIVAMTRCAKPIVARVHGKTVGGGVGIGPFVVGPAIERKIGPGAFAAMALDADWRDAVWGERHGLYARICATTADLDAAVSKTAQTLSGANPDAVQRIKQIASSGTDDWPTLLDERAAMSGTLVLSDYTRQAIAAFGK
jgi:methylglutaconyl-CoA hydratase